MEEEFERTLSLKQGGIPYLNQSAQNISNYSTMQKNLQILQHLDSVVKVYQR